LQLGAKVDLISNSSSSLDHIPNTLLAHLVSSSDALMRSWKNQQVAHEESLLQQDLGPGMVNLVELEKGGAVVPAAVAGPDLLLGSSQDLHHVDNSSCFQKSLLQEWESMHATPGPTGLKIYDSLAMHAGLAATDSPVFNQAAERRSPAAGLQMFQSLPEAAAAAAETAETASDQFQQLPLEQQCPLSNLSSSSLTQYADLVDHQQHMISPTSTLCSLDHQAHHQGLSSASISSSTSPAAANSVELLHAGSYLQKPAAADHSFILNMMQLLKNSVQSSSAGSLEISCNQSCSGTTTTGLVQHGPPTTISSPMFSSSSASSQSPPSPWQQQQSLNHDHKKVEESIKLHLNAASPGISASSLISAETQEKQQQLNLISRSSLSPQITSSSSSSIISHSCSSSAAAAAAAISQIPAAPSELLLMDHIPGQSNYTNMSRPSSCVSQSKSSSATTVGGTWSQHGSSMESKEYWTNMLQLVGPPASCCNQILTCATTVPTIINQ
jgi:hypothetical protein